MGQLAHGNVPDATCKNALVPPQALCIDAVPPEGGGVKREQEIHVHFFSRDHDFNVKNAIVYR